MSERSHVKPVENFTVPFLVTFGVLLFTTLIAILATAGFLAVIVLAALAEMGLRWIEARRAP